MSTTSLCSREKMKRRRSSTVGQDTITNKSKKENILALIIDNGAYNIKAGLSIDESPSLIPNCIMKAKSERKRLFVGKQITECRDCSGLYFLLPCERGYITKWDVQKPVWDHIFGRNVYPIDDKPIIMTQPLFNFKSVQDCIDEIFFEEYEVPSMFRLNPTDLARLKYIEEKSLPDKSDCIIVDSGFSFTHVVPYIDGNKYLRGIQRVNVGGKLLTNHLKDIISYRQYNVMEETFVINQVKEDTCYVANNIIEELKLASKKNNSIVKNYVLPDFNNIRRGYIQDPNNIKEMEENCQILRLNNERFVVPEILFHPSDIGMKSMGIAEAVIESISKCPKDHRESLAKNVILIGGNCKFPGFKERMYAELRSHLPSDLQINIHLSKDPITYSWEGGRSLLKVPNFKSFLVTKSEYEELGSSIIQQRFNNWMVDNSEPEPEREKPEETFCYLDSLRGQSIFGKRDPVGNDPKPSDEASSNKEPDKSSTTGTSNFKTSGLDVRTESTELSDQAQENFQQSNDGDAAKPKKASQKFNESTNSEELRDECEDLLNSTDLFPFGRNSYL